MRPGRGPPAGSISVGATGIEGAPESPAASTSEAREPDKTGADAIGESTAKSTVLDAESTRAAEPDPDAALRAAIKAAVDSGQWTRVRALTDVLERSEAKAAPVVELVAHRRREGG